MSCGRCGAELIGKESLKFGFCSDCRRESFGFDNPRRFGRPRHTEMKDRRTCNVVGASATDFATNMG